MCGIVAYLGPAQARAILLGGLARLEYRGYDSAGLAVMQNDGSTMAESSDSGSSDAHKADSANKRPSIFSVGSVSSTSKVSPPRSQRRPTY